MSKKYTEAELIKYILACRHEAYEAKKTRMALNKQNYEVYHLEHDWSHKSEGQSKEVLGKQRMATEQTKSFFQQSLSDLGDWWSAKATDNTDGSQMLIKPEEIQKLTNYMLKKAGYYSHVGNSVQSAVLSSLMISRVGGKLVPKPKYVVKKTGRGKNYKKTLVKVEDKTWELCFDRIRAEDYYPDPTGLGLYEIYEDLVDMHTVIGMSEGEDAIFDKAVVDALQPYYGDTGDLQESKKSRETGQDEPVQSFRPKVKLTTFYGTVVDTATGKIECENVYITMANDTHIIRMPAENPYWHQSSDIVAAPLIEVDQSVWHVALADVGSALNITITEIFNLMLDSAMNAVHGIKQIRTDALEDPSQIAKGIRPGMTLKTNSLLAPGQKVIETVVTGNVPPEAVTMLNLTNQEFNSSMLTNDLRQGVMPFRQVKATEVVESSNSITSVFQGMAKNIEEKKIQRELDLAWKTTAQNMDKIDREVFIGLFGAERGAELAQLDPEDIFASTVNGVRFEVYGISQTLSKSMDFRKYTTLMQTIASSEMFLELFLQGYDPQKFLGEIITSLDINKLKIQLDAQPQPAQAPEGPEAGMPPGMEAGVPGMGGPDMMSQVPQAGAGNLADIFGGGAGRGGVQ